MSRWVPLPEQRRKALRIVPAFLGLSLLAACASTGEPGQVVNREFTASLTGYQQTPHRGDLDGTGYASLRLARIGAPELCWEMSVRGIGPATAAHLHRGAAGAAGPPVVPFTTPDAAGVSRGCAPVDANLAQEIAVQPHLFYVNVHNAEFPAGAIRGQLRGRILGSGRATRG